MRAQGIGWRFRDLKLQLLRSPLSVRQKLLDLSFGRGWGGPGKAEELQPAGPSTHGWSAPTPNIQRASWPHRTQAALAGGASLGAHLPCSPLVDNSAF